VSGTAISQTNPEAFQTSETVPLSWPRTVPSSTRVPKPCFSGGASIGGPPLSTQRSRSISVGSPSFTQLMAMRPPGVESPPYFIALGSDAE